jgi:hypothetical protein
MGSNPHSISGAQFVAPEEPFQIFTKKPDVRFLSRGVQPPSQVYVSVGDDIVVGGASSVAGETVTFSYRLLRFDGELVLGQFQLALPADRSLKVYRESLAEGFLLSVSCKAAAATTRGQTFVRVFLTDPALGAGQPSYMLMADYVTTAMAPAHPNGRVLSPPEGPGNLKAFIVGAPAPGADWQLTVPTNARWRIETVRADLATSAAAGNRTPRLFFGYGGPSSGSYAPIASQAPGTSFTYAAANTTEYNTPASLTSAWPLPANLVLLAGMTIQSTTIGLDAADQWSGIAVYVEEWLDNV